MGGGGAEGAGLNRPEDMPRALASLFGVTLLSLPEGPTELPVKARGSGRIHLFLCRPPTSSSRGPEPTRGDFSCVVARLRDGRCQQVEVPTEHKAGLPLQEPTHLGH